MKKYLFLFYIIVLFLTQFLFSQEDIINEMGGKWPVTLVQGGYHGRNDLIDKALAKGININAKAKAESTCSSARSALGFAAERGHVDTAEYLLGKGADINLVDESKMTPLLVASEKGHLEMTQLLVDKGAKTQVKEGTYGMNWLQIAIEGINEDVNSSSKRLDLIKYILQTKPDLVNTADNYSKTAIFTSVTRLYKKDPVVKLLLDNGAKVDVQDKNKMTPLMWASENGLVESAKLMLDQDANVNLKDSEGRTALYLAFTPAGKCFHNDPSSKERQDSLELFQVLLKKGANVNDSFKDSYGKKETLLAKATSYSPYLDLVKLFLENGANVNASADGIRNHIQYAIINSADKEILELLVEYKADLDIIDKEGKNALHHAAQYISDRPKWELLFPKSNPKSLNALDRDGNSPLMIACKNGNLEAAKFLLENKADKTLRNKRKQTALDLAKSLNNTDYPEEKKELLKLLNY